MSVRSKAALAVLCMTLAGCASAVAPERQTEGGSCANSYVTGLPILEPEDMMWLEGVDIPARYEI